MTTTHGGVPPVWGLWRAVEGGMLLDRQALYEAYLVADGANSDDPSLRERAAARIAAAPTEKRAALDELGSVLDLVLAAGLEECPHGLPVGIDLSIPNPFRPVPDLEIRRDVLERHGDGVHELALLAGPAWGAGSSPWTRVLLEMLRRHVQPGDRVADVGTGTGILALYAARLGASVADAVDTDRVAAAVARRNAHVNGLASIVRVHLGSTEQLDGTYDLAVVSLGNVRELTPVIAATAARLRPGATLIASPAEGPADRDSLAEMLRVLGCAPFDSIECEGWYVLAGHTGG